MAYELPVWTQTFAAGADLSAAANQFKLVKLDASGNVVLCAAVTDIPIGVLQNTPASGHEAVVMIEGTSKVSAGGALSIGALVGTDVNGQGAAYVAGTDTTKYIIGRVLVATAAQNGYATVAVSCAAPHRAA